MTRNDKKILFAKRRHRRRGRRISGHRSRAGTGQETERIYTWSDHCYVNPMPLYEKPLELKSGDNFTLDYEVSVF